MRKDQIGDRPLPDPLDTSALFQRVDRHVGSWRKEDEKKIAIAISFAVYGMAGFFFLGFVLGYLAAVFLPGIR